MQYFVVVETSEKADQLKIEDQVVAWWHRNPGNPFIPYFERFSWSVPTIWAGRSLGHHVGVGDLVIKDQSSGTLSDFSVPLWCWNTLLEDHPILFVSNNATAVAHIKHKKGTRSLTATAGLSEPAVSGPVAVVPTAVGVPELHLVTSLLPVSTTNWTGLSPDTRIL